MICNSAGNLYFYWLLLRKYSNNIAGATTPAGTAAIREVSAAEAIARGYWAVGKKRTRY
jgi:hypothetical protein